MIADGRYMEMLWRQYRKEPGAVASDWRHAFSFIEQFYGDPFAAAILPNNSNDNLASDLERYMERFGHLHADLDPLGLQTATPLPARFAANSGRLYNARQVGVETGHLDSVEMADWVVAANDALDIGSVTPDPTTYRELLETEVFDQFLTTKFPGKKRFGSEGADAILPLLHAIRRKAAEQGVDEIVIGSMHRGRLSILANFSGQSVSTLLARMNGQHPFAGRDDLPADVPYHLGQLSVRDGVRSILLPNPSHLEAVNPVVLGYARARRTYGSGRAMALIIHTDASVIGQGVNAELLQMSALAGFEVGGTIHIVINNQIGFTTEPSEGRSSRYCTGPWRAVDSLIVHVNGDDVDTVVRTGELAMDFRARFAREAVIDLVCYRANGHNEIDEPRFTQPAYYRAVDARKSVVAKYERCMIEAGLLTADEAAGQRASIRSGLEAAFAAQSADAGDEVSEREQPSTFTWNDDDLREIGSLLAIVPEGEGNAKMIKLMERRLREIDEGITWPAAEAMALAITLRAGLSVRLCGQDVERGPFSQRHLAAVHPDTGERRHGVKGAARDGATVEIINSPLSEYAVLGFEYGYSLGSPRMMCIWEAQFGDFMNGAQIMIDQFIASGFEKWRQTSNLTVLLPHGLEGQGPEHSSARVERLLQLCARGNISVAHPSTPANYFHLLVEQATRGNRPLFILTPKVLLRLPEARSALDQLTSDAGFVPVVTSGASRANRAVVCSGKIAYELERERNVHGIEVAIVRLEQLYPFPVDSLRAALKLCEVREMLWLQEEPENLGAGTWLLPKLAAVATSMQVGVLPMVARGESASPAGSFHAWHDRDQRALLRRALGVRDDDAR